MGLCRPSRRTSTSPVGRRPLDPFNGGLWTLSNPSRELYEAGLALLNRGVWNVTHGFNLSGRPREHFARLPGLERMRHTTMFRQNTWNVAFGDCDQGFLFHMFYLHEPRDGGGPIGADFEPIPEGLNCGTKARDFRTDTVGHCPHTARHYWGPKKPWQLERDNRGRVAHYLAHTDFRHSHSACAQRFASYAAQLPWVNASRIPSKSNGKMQRVR